MPEINKITLSAARDQLWYSGVLTWKLRSHQKKLYDSYTNCKEKMVVWNCSRRLGKSYALCIIALETCLKTPNSFIKYCCSQQNDARDIIRPLIYELIEDCPLDIRPEFKTQENTWVFPNGSRIQVKGLDGGKADSIRGGAAHLVVVDEAGFVRDLDKVINKVLLPTTLTTKGKIILASTPSESPDHPFVTIYLNKARIEENLVTMTVYENPYLERDELDKIIAEYVGGVANPDFRREYLCEILIDEQRAIIPEFSKVKDKVVRDWKRAPFYDSYVAMDIGVKDLTVVLFAWYDFLASKIIVEDEYVVNGQKYNTNTLAENIKSKEDKLFTDPMTGECRRPFLRVSDTTLTVINDLRQSHDLMFLPTGKTDADAALNKVRMMIQNEQIIINPRCVHTINHLEKGIWNKNKTSFERSSDFGHYDAIDALKYLVRNVQLTKNPYPPHYLNPTNSNQFILEKQQQTQQKQEWMKVFAPNKPREQEKAKEIVKIMNKPIKRW